ncbi:MAG: HAD hydrolase family protein [Burkholderiales bacterium]|nr:HAD hydrolase family protein [Burkholderiales bacterium]
MIKAIIMDGDGSTITQDNKLPDNLRDLICNNPQLKWIMATGRSMDLLRATPIYDYLSDDIYHIVDGGSCLMYKSGSIYKQHLLGKDEVDIFFAKLQLQHTNWLYYSPDGYKAFVYTTQDKLKEKANKISDFITITENLSEFRDYLSTFPAGKIFLNVSQEFDLSGVHYQRNENNFDITKHGIHKGSAFIDMLADLGLQASEAVFIFNDSNDLPIVNHPDLSGVIKIKVGDYLPNINADYHVKTPYDVANILRQII